MNLATSLAMMRTAAVVLVGSLALTGCVETRFAAPLGDNIETCDTRLKGLWLDAKEDHADAKRNTKPDPSADGINIDAGCRVEMLEQPEPGGAIKRIHVPVNFVHDGGNDYLVVSDAQLNGLVELAPPYAVSPTPQKSFFFVRYHITGDTLELFDVDTKAVAKLVIDGTLRGTVSSTTSELHAWVDGNRNDMLELVRKQPIFEDKPNLTLRRSRQTLADFERNATKKPAPPKKNPSKK